MPGHVVRLATVAGSAAAALLLSVSGAAACGTCGCGHYQSYAVATPSVGYAVQASCGAAVYQPHVVYKPHVAQALSASVSRLGISSLVAIHRVRSANGPHRGAGRTRGIARDDQPRVAELAR